MTTNAPDPDAGMMAEPEVSEDDLAHIPSDEDDLPLDGPDEPSDAVKQATYLADRPDWAVTAPSGSDFANATWLKAGGDVLALIHEVFEYEEFRELGMLPYVVRWRRKTKPQLRNRYGEVPLFATIDITHPRTVWEAHRRELLDWPRLTVDLSWQHWEDRIKEGAYVHGADVQWAVHRALSVIEVDNDIVRRIPPDVSVSEHEVRRFGMKGPGWGKTFRAQQTFWPDDGLAEA